MPDLAKPDTPVSRSYTTTRDATAVSCWADRAVCLSRSMRACRLPVGSGFGGSPTRQFAHWSALITDPDMNQAYDARTDRSLFTTAVRRSTA